MFIYNKYLYASSQLEEDYPIIFVLEYLLVIRFTGRFAPIFRITPVCRSISAWSNQGSVMFLLSILNQ